MQYLIINNFFYQTCVTVCITLFIYSCAAVSPPDGGPEDKIPPELISSYPEEGSLRFKGGEVKLKFSEYIDEKSIQSAIQISPVLDPPVEIKYNDDEIILLFPEKLLPNQTYVITINRNLKDERKVTIKQSIQIAFSTGDIIDKGEIKGQIYGEENYAVHLWKLKNGFVDSIFVTEPLYISEADDSGLFSFKYLSPGEYTLLGLDRSAAGAALIPSRMAYGVTPQKIYSIKEDSIISRIPIRPIRETPKLKLTYGEWIGKKWGWINFNQEMNEPIFKGIKLIDPNESIIIPELKQDLEDSKKFLMIAPDTLSKGKSEFVIDEVLLNDQIELKDAKISFRTITKIDTNHLEIISPTSSTSIRLDKDGGPKLPIIFSKPILDFSDSSFMMVSDSDTTVTNLEWINPTSTFFRPFDGWEEKKDYKLLIFSSELTPIEGKSFKDSIVYVNINSGKKMGYGGLKGSINFDLKSVLIELKSLENKEDIFHSIVNSNYQFEFNKIPEGSYTLMIINDINNDGMYNFGSVFPFKASEWFYSYSDTFKVRANWDIDIGQLDIEEK